MPISFNRYVNIQSGISAGVTVPRRHLVTRIFTTNPILAPQSYVQFSTAAEVGQFFGTTSVEYARALFYFSWTSKANVRPQFLQFARWAMTAVAPMIFGNTNQAQSLATYTAITAGSFSLTMGNVTLNLTGLNFAAATSLADVAAILQTAVRTGVNTQFSNATVTYNAAGNGTFNLVGGSPVSANVSVAPGVTGTDISAIIGWYPQQTVSTFGNLVAGAIWTPGSLAETITQTLTTSSQVSNNFGSFLFMANLTLAMALSAAQWNEALNIEYMFLLSIFSANLNAGQSGDMNWAATDGSALGLIGGIAATLHGPSGEYHEMIPGMILAATNYSNINSVQNYMFQQFALSATVTNDANANLYDSLKVNYYGDTQDAGQQINFYQRGVMFGLPSDPADQNVYANEMWLKDAIGTSIMSALLGLNKISANQHGRTQITALITPNITEGLNNGTISVGKPLIQQQIVYITEQTGDENAWHQVQTLGYWLNVFIVYNQQAVPTPGYEANYLLVYSKDDIIRKVNGVHSII